MRLKDICKILACAILIAVSMMACSDDVVCPDSIDSPVQTRSSVEEMDSTARLSFTDEMDLSEAISSNSDDSEGTSVNSLQRVQSISQANPKFVSLMAVRPVTDVSQPQLTYYEALGYDSLVPNPKFAQLLNTKGEVEVGSDIIKITPKGTYRFNKRYEDEFNNLYSKNPEIVGTRIDSICNRINDHILLYRTFQEPSNAYDLINAGDEFEYPDSYFGDEEDENNVRPVSVNTRSNNEPDYNSFATFSADRKTFIGKFIQSIIGASKTHTINFSKKRRVRGSFYFYNYGVYAEIGVKGWTDKKNWIGWSKTPCDELRVGWNNVVLKTTYPDNFKKAMQNIKSMAYVEAQPTKINGRMYNTAAIIMPDYKPGLKDKIIAQGAKAVYNFIKSECKNPPTTMEKIEAFLVATRTEVLFVAAPETVVKYNSKYYCHVFHKQWMDFTVGWSNNKGFFFGTGNLTLNNINEIGPWVKTAADVFNQKKTKLIGGEVYICARFGNAWKGMKIVKKAN